MVRRGRVVVGLLVGAEHGSSSDDSKVSGALQNLSQFRPRICYCRVRGTQSQEEFEECWQDKKGCPLLCFPGGVVSETLPPHLNGI
jgi:hypothetical protein